MERLIWIFVGSGLGGVARHALNGWVTAKAGSAFPWGTLAVNLTGSWAIGFAATLLAGVGRAPGAQWAGDFLVVGVLGGFTTYSAYALQTLLLARGGHEFRATVYAAGTRVLCLLAVALGTTMARGLRP